jgi:hypothetical protein
MKDMMADKENGVERKIQTPQILKEPSHKVPWYRKPITRFLVVLTLILIFLTAIMCSCLVIWIIFWGLSYI